MFIRLLFISKKKHLLNWSKIVILILSVALMFAACSSDIQVEKGVKNSTVIPSQSQQETITPTPSTMCKVHEGGSIKAALNDTSCTTITVYSGDYRKEGWYKFERSGVTLQAEGEAIIDIIIVYGNNNIVRGFTITNPEQKTCIRTYGDNNLIENNECYNTAEDGMWLWGRNNIIRGNYIHDIYDDRNWPSFDNHVDCFMTWAWSQSYYNSVDNLLIEGNTCILDRSHGSNQFFILTHDDNSVPITNITFRNNVFIANDTGYVPIAFFGDSSVTGIQVINNTFYNTTGQGDEAVWAENMPDVFIANNAIIGYNSIARVVESNVTDENNVIDPPYGMVNYQSFDFHLLAGSLLIDAGVSLGLEYDFDGNLRDEKPDIGAFEYHNP